MKGKHLGYFNKRRQRILCIFTDWFTTFVAFFCFDVFRFYFLGIGGSHASLSSYIFSSKLILEQFFVPLVLLMVYWLSGYYNHPFERSRLNEFLTTFYSQLFNAILIYLAALTNDQLYLRRENWFVLMVLFLFLFIFTYSGRLLITNSMQKTMKRKKAKPRTVIVGLSDDTGTWIDKLHDSESKPEGKVVGLIPFGNENVSPKINKDVLDEVPMLEDLDDIKAMCEKGTVDQVIIVPPQGKSPVKKVLYLLHNLYPYNISIKISPDIFSLVTPAIRLQDIMDEPLVDLSSPKRSEFSKNVKRALDFVVSLFGLVILSPLFLSLAIAVKSSGKGPVFYSQERVGSHRKPFRIHKFRSMVPEAEKDGVPMLTGDSDDRITPVGKWMRKYRLDELPQLWNVLKGEMSLVGPRPERAYFIEKIFKKAPWYTLVLQVKPGITSWGMVKYGYASDIDQMIERNRYDLIYLANMSLSVDLKILIHTIRTVGLGKGK